MKIKNEPFFVTIRSFFEIYLVKNRSCSPNTVKSYKDAMNLYLDFLEEAKNIPTARAGWNCFSRQFVQEFLIWLEEKRGCSKRTQRQRLTAIRSFVRYGGILDVCIVAVQADVEKIKLRKPPQKLVHWLTKEELAVFLSQPDSTKRTGLRDMVFLILLYDTAARCQEMVDLKIQDLILDKVSPCVYLTGKGSKTRVVPLLPKTVEHLRSYVFIGWAFLKLGTAYRLAAGSDFAHKLIGLGQTVGAAFADFAPGLAPFDWLVGIVGAAAFRLLIYFKSKNAKKFRRDAEYGSARWSA